MASGVAGGSTASAPSGSAPAPGSRAAGTDNGRHQDDDGFAGVLARSSSANHPAGTAATAAGEQEAAPVAASDEQASGVTDEGVNKDSDQDNLPEQILALLGGTWPGPAAGAPPTLVPITAVPANGPDSTDMLAANPTELMTSAGPADAVSGQLAVTDTAGKMPALLPGTLAGNAAAGDGTLPTADFAKALGLVGAQDGAEALPVLPTPGARTDSIEFVLPGSQVAANSPIRAAAETIAATPIPMPADPDTGFDDALGTRISWLADQRIGRAEIRVSPDHLGPIDVRLHIDGSRVSAEFTSANADVRQALEASVGRLRDMLAQQGLQLAQSDVGSQQSNSRGGQITGDATDLGDAEIVDIPTATILRRGLLDEYA